MSCQPGVTLYFWVTQDQIVLGCAERFVAHCQVQQKFGFNETWAPLSLCSIGLISLNNMLTGSGLSAVRLTLIHISNNPSLQGSESRKRKIWTLFLTNRCIIPRYFSPEISQSSREIFRGQFWIWRLIIVSTDNSDTPPCLLRSSVSSVIHPKWHSHTKHVNINQERGSTCWKEVTRRFTTTS